VRQQPGADRAARDRLGRQRCLHGLDVVPLLFAAPTQVGRPLQDADEQTGRAIVETLGYVGADADADFSTARAGPLRLREIEHFALAGQISTPRSPAVAPALPDHGRTENIGRRHGHCFLSGSAEIEERRAVDALAPPAEGEAHQVLNVGVLLIAGRPQSGDRGEQLGDHLLEDAGVVRQVRRIKYHSRYFRAHALVDAPGSSGIPASAQDFGKKWSAQVAAGSGRW